MVKIYFTSFCQQYCKPNDIKCNKECIGLLNQFFSHIFINNKSNKSNILYKLETNHISK